MKLFNFPRPFWPMLFIFVFMGYGQALLRAQTDKLEKKQSQPAWEVEDTATYHAYSYFLLGVIYETRALELEDLLRVSLAQEPDSQVDLAGMVAERGALWLKALGAFREALLFAPEASLVYRHMALAYFILNQPQVALEHLSQAGRLAPEDFMTHYEFGQWLEKEGQIDEALAEYEIACKARPSAEKKAYLPRLLLHLGDLYTHQEEFEKGERAYRQLLKLAEEGHSQVGVSPAQVHTRLGVLLLRAKRPQEALEEISIARKLGLNDARYHFLLAQVHHELQQYDKATKESKAFLKKKPGNIEGLRLLAGIYEASGEPDQAIIECEAHLAQDEGNLGLRYLLGELYEKAGNEEKAVEHFAYVIANARKRFLPPYLKLAKIYQTRGDYALALHLLIRAVGKGLTSGDVFGHIDEVLQGVAEPLKVATCLEGISGEGKNFAFYYILGRLYNDVGESRKTMASFSEAVRLQPHLWVAYMYLAFLKMEEDDIEGAIEVLEQGAAMNAGPGVLYKMLGQLLVEKEDFARAEKILLRALILDKDDVAVRFSLAIVYDELGQDEKSEQELLKCLELDPDNPDANNALGYFYAERSKNLKRAVRLIKKALKVESENGAYLDSLGWAYFKMGRTKEAFKLLEQAASFLPDPVILDHLGDVYYSLGDETRAREKWTKALSLSPKDKDKKKLEKKLKDLAVPLREED